jgi:hypothetical protein
MASRGSPTRVVIVEIRTFSLLVEEIDYEQRKTGEENMSTEGR